MSDKEQRRNLQKEVGRVAADAIAAMGQDVNRTVLEHRVLARQMLDFETTVAAVKASRAFDRHIIDSHTAELKCQEERTADCKREARAENDMLETWIRRFESMTFRQRLRWLLTGALTWTPPVAAGTEDPSPAPAYPGDGL